MKRKILLIISIFIAFITIGCDKNPSTTEMEDMAFEEEDLRFDIEQIVFSKSFQSIEPNVEVISKNNKLKLMASLGLSEHSSVNINKIIKKGNEVSIHVSGTTSIKNMRLAVPQVFMELNKSDFNNIDDLKFNVVYDDYTHLKIKLGINDMINKVESNFKIISKRIPNFNLIKKGNDIIWEISYKGVFDKENPDMPLVNLSALIDANTGDVLESTKDIISTSIDFGRILDNYSNSQILYKKTGKDIENSSEQLWYYNIKEDESYMVFSSDYKIISSQFNEDKSYVSLIESNEDNSNLYIISTSDNRAFKISHEDNFNPKLAKWKDKNSLYLIENLDNASNVFLYNLKENEINYIGKYNKNISNLIIYDDLFLITEKTDDEFNRKISITKDWNYFDSINTGFNTKFINENTIAFLYNEEKSNSNYLYIYDFNENEFLDIIEGNISYYEVLPSNNLIYTNKNTTNDDYSIYKYSLENNESSLLTTLMGDRVLYIEDNVLYLNLSLPLEDKKTEMIYSIDLDKLNFTNN